MKILWLTNIPLPEVSLLMKEPSIPFGGWLVNASADLSEVKDLYLSILFPKANINNIEYFKGKEIKYFAFPNINLNDKFLIERNIYFEKVLKEVNPDIVHIFGTEYPHTLSMVNTCKKMNIKSIISIQGLVSIIAQHYMACLPEHIQRKFTLRDFIKQDNIKQQQKKFINKGKFEIKAIQKVYHVIGRTTWDRACVSQINFKAQYHFCNETLRSEFYKHEWVLQNCVRNTIFVSQGSYPIKGLHFILEAMPLILKRFPNTILYVSGPNIFKSNTIKDKLKKTSYAMYIKNLINNLNLSDKIKFTGLLDEREMAMRYLKSNVFVCPSSIENSPNSLGEAMILGLPCIASDVGGISDMLKHNEEGFLYPADAHYMLAYYVCEIFRDDNIASTFSKKARYHALKTHDRSINIKSLLEIYKNVNHSIK